MKCRYCTTPITEGELCNCCWEIARRVGSMPVKFLHELLKNEAPAYVQYVKAMLR